MGDDANWRDFLEDVPWFLEPGDEVTVHARRPRGAWTPESGFEALFPTLTTLLRAAEVTELTTAGGPRRLFTWSYEEDGTRHWLCPPASPTPPARVHPSHAVLLRSFGGVVERGNEPASWLLNHNEALTEAEAAFDASFLAQYAWAFAEAPGYIPIEQAAFYSIAREANGNETLCHRGDGTVLLFAPDHAFDHVTTLAGCARNTLYTLNGAPTFVEWVETVAAQWSAAVDLRG